MAIEPAGVRRARNKPQRRSVWRDEDRKYFKADEYEETKQQNAKYNPGDIERIERIEDTHGNYCFRMVLRKAKTLEVVSVRSLDVVLRI